MRMFIDPTDIMVQAVVGAFFLGWLVGKVSAFFGNRYSSRTRDPRDDRIRSLSADLRVAKTETEKIKERVEERDKELAKVRTQLDSAERHLDKSEERLADIRSDLKDSVAKTRELREELANRAEENLKSEVKLREVETELSVAQASTDMIATGVLDYTLTGEDEEEHRQIQSANG